MFTVTTLRWMNTKTFWMKKYQNHAYYSEITHNVNNNSGYNVTMKPTISYSIIQNLIAMTTNSSEGESSVSTRL